MLDKAIRDLDRERMGLQNQEKRIITDIKKMAKEGQMVGSNEEGWVGTAGLQLVQVAAAQMHTEVPVEFVVELVMRW
jgi:hypothetical protein